MGYTTEFDGHFTLTPPPPAEVVLQLMDLAGVCKQDELGDRSMPASYNQWELTRDRQHLQWDGGEKFYHYVEWLQWLMDHVLTPAGVTVSGTVDYSGEAVTDVGTLTIVDGVVVKQTKAVSNTQDLAELQAFKEFVLESRYGRELLHEWMQQRDSPRGAHDDYAT